ncbi:hypothetical protein CSC2_07360 [Clostridium zeae]|uniref:Sugar fermentation stimulation protein n=1 Tax=Clostridium zeae TaxID=2759022 RepID=A0ABQ1E635_9CLOT|nr:DNA/RNA nuclease SfsA [Clostridium zeae]GFZ30210.1 hypothetical protein CSC2_07360 [Clostridium zeae]
MNNMDIIFESQLVEGTIQKRKSQFTIIVEVDGVVVTCHCPTTGRIANIDLSGIQCLLSKSKDSTRKTPYTVEAISLNRPEDKDKSWIGINQNAVNRYVEYYLKNDGFADMIGTGNEVLREQVIGISKLDFLVGDIYLEVKTPLQQLQVHIPDYVKIKKSAPFSSTDRFVKHITQLADSLESHQRAILLTCFIYDNPGFQVIERSTRYEEVTEAVSYATDKGVEIWQANFKIIPAGVCLDKYFKLDL